MKLKNEYIERAAKQHLEGIEDNIERTLTDCYFPHDEMDDVHEFVTDAFKTGAVWGVWMATKDLWHSGDEAPVERGKDILMYYESYYVGVSELNHDEYYEVAYTEEGFTDDTWIEFCNSTGCPSCWLYLDELLKEI